MMYAVSASFLPALNELQWMLSDSSESFCGYTLSGTEDRQDSLPCLVSSLLYNEELPHPLHDSLSALRWFLCGVFCVVNLSQSRYIIL